MTVLNYDGLSAPRAPAIRYLFLLAIVAAATVATWRFLSLSWQVLHFPYPLEYGEGTVLDVAARLAHLQTIYPRDLTDPPWFVANYPPLFYLTHVPAIWLQGPQLWFGRLLSQISALAVASLIGLVLHRLSKDSSAAVLAAATFLAIPFVAVWSQYDRVDMLALALNWMALWILVRRADPRSGHVIIAATCLVASSFTRQTGAVAGAITGYLWLRSSGRARDANRLLLLVASIGCGLFLILDAVTGRGFSFHVIRGTVGRLSAEQLLGHGRRPLELMPFLLAAAAGSVLWGWRYQPRGWSFVASYVIAAALLALTVAKEGSHINYFLDLSAACSLAAGACAAWLRSRQVVVAACLLLFAIQMVVMARPNRLYDNLAARLRRSADYARLERLVSQADGPVLADEPIALLPLTGQPANFHPFAMTQLFDGGLWDDTRFLDALRQARFRLVLLRMPVRDPRIIGTFWTDRMASAILENYERSETVVVDDGALVAVYRPKKKAPAASLPRAPREGRAE